MVSDFVRLKFFWCCQSIRSMVCIGISHTSTNQTQWFIESKWRSHYFIVDVFASAAVIDGMKRVRLSCHTKCIRVRAHAKCISDLSFSIKQHLVGWDLFRIILHFNIYSIDLSVDDSYTTQYTYNVLNDRRRKEKKKEKKKQYNSDSNFVSVIRTSKCCNRSHSASFDKCEW